MPLAEVIGNQLKILLGFTDIEPILLIYMLTSFMKMPVFNALILDKCCAELHPVSDATVCVSEHPKDDTVTTYANRVFLYSTICLVIPSIVTSSLIGSLGDKVSRKVAILIPLVGLVMCNLNYIVQSVYINASVYWLLLSDIIFGSLGGYSAIISTTLSYGADAVCVARRSYKMSTGEAAIGLGGTIGFLLSGVVLEAISYSGVFLLLSCLTCVAFLYTLIFISDLPVAELNSPSGLEQSEQQLIAGDELRTRTPAASLCCWRPLKDFLLTIIRPRSGHRRLYIVLILIAFIFSFIVFSGSGAIMFYYLTNSKHFTWSRTLYGYFRGVYYGSSTLMVMLLFPLLKKMARFSDTSLVLIGLVSRAVGCLMLAFAFATWFVFTVPLVYMFNRFAAAGMRSLLSKQVERDEQGKIFAVIGVLEGVANLISSSLFNGWLYPATQSSFAGASYVVMSGFMVIAIITILIIHVHAMCSTNSTEPQIEVSIDGS